ncbi:hypothetical protein Ct61P_14654 [Colletotrichum tofieldiae]|nr:hypothetical protein Ct61P_14654 [Colletotrichum tofieldiae]
MDSALAYEKRSLAFHSANVVIVNVQLKWINWKTNLAFFDSEWSLTHADFVDYAAECTNDHNNLRRWHLAGSGDDSASVVGRHDTFTLAQFYDWNRAVGTNCAGFWLGYWYCIGEIFTLTPTLIVADLGLCRR